ncbi:MAG TPA: SIMPL domain-containing protein [Albitalea sp.]|jgi:predicted secreted protein|nr:SIMPL domain-containing protein [Albitalea sp.]
MKNCLALTVLLMGIGSAGIVRSADAPAPSGVVNLSSTAAIDVARDLMSVTLTQTREGADANAVQAALKQALDAALAEAKRVAKPGQVDVQTGNFSLYPRYTNKGVMSGWQGAAELVVEGRDMPAIGQLVGRISTMTVARVVQGLSRELREKSEAEVSAQAIARYRAKAADYAKQFGYAGYAIREVNVTASEPPGGPVPMMRAKAMSAQEDASLPVEAGKAPVAVTVSGSVQMLK